MPRAGAIVALGVLLLPQTMAATAEGTFVGVGGAVFPRGAELHFTPFLTVLNDTMGLRTLTLRIPSGTLRYYDSPFTEAGTPIPAQVLGPRRDERLELEDATLTLAAGSHGGYLALFRNRGGVATFRASEGMLLSPQERTEFTTGGAIATTSQSRSQETTHSHSETVAEIHLATASEGTLGYRGAGVLKLYGPDVLLRAHGVERVYRTGLERETDEPVREGARRWLVVEFSESEFEASSAQPWLIAGANVEASWDGSMDFQPVSGVLRSGETEYAAGGAPARLTGVLTAALGVVKKTGAPLLTTWRVTGALDKTSLDVGQVLPPAPARTTGGWGILAGVLVGISVAGSYTAVHIQRRRPTPRYPASVEDCHEAATAAASHEDWAEAAEWFARARRLAPTSSRLCADLAFALSQMGDHDEALRLYEEASRLSSDGEADLNGALTALEAGKGPGEVERWLVRCLARTPEMVMDLDGDEAFAPLRGRAGYEAALARAWDRLAGEGFGLA